MTEDESGGEPPCFAHEMIGGHAVDPATKREVDRFRKVERERLYALRRAMPQADRTAQTARVTDALTDAVGDVTAKVVAAYWPIRGELDLRPWMTTIHDRGATVALPVVVERGRPVEFHRWTPRCEMTRGAWNIPVPAAVKRLVPDIVIVPLVGADRACFRLGNGGGYYDMTFAAFTDMPRRIAVGQDFCLLPSIFPQPWDVPMDIVLLGDRTSFQLSLSA